MKFIKRSLRGTSLILASILGLSTLSLTGLGMDASWIYTTKSQLQNVADAAALAGAQGLEEDTPYALAQAQATALNNVMDGAPIQLETSDVVFGTWNGNTFTPGSANPNAVQVSARRYANSPNGALPLFFSGLFGVSSINVSATAIAFLDTTTSGGSGSSGSSNDPAPPGVIVLPPGGTGGGTGNQGAWGCTGGSCGTGGFGQGCGVCCQNGSCLNCNGCSCACDCNLSSDSTCSINASCVNVSGGCSCGGSCSGALNTNCCQCADPLANWSSNIPTSSSCGSTCTQTSGTVLQPGYYPNGINLSSGNCTLESGTYVCGGSGFSCSGNASCTGSGVTICCQSGGFQCSSSGNICLSPPTSGSCAGVTICQPSSNTSPCSFSGCGSGCCQITGTIYCPNANVNVDSCSGLQLGNQLITDGLNLSNNSTVSVGGGPVSEDVVYLVQ
ncbi:MAG TPA: TadG family pilus assembly protein [Phycisphaerae bacterium]|nr:TadG family pilus assembly protein [Phycisphaerae bacterium]